MHDVYCHVTWGIRYWAITLLFDFDLNKTIFVFLPALKVTMHLRQANSVASKRSCRNLATTSCNACISEIILFSFWESVLSPFMPGTQTCEINTLISHLKYLINWFLGGWEITRINSYSIVILRDPLPHKTDYIVEKLVWNLLLDDNKHSNLHLNDNARSRECNKTTLFAFKYRFINDRYTLLFRRDLLFFTCCPFSVMYFYGNFYNKVIKLCNSYPIQPVEC